jgi:hypothetical protein
MVRRSQTTRKANSTKKGDTGLVTKVASKTTDPSFKGAVAYDIQRTKRQWASQEGRPA